MVVGAEPIVQGVGAEPVKSWEVGSAEPMLSGCRHGAEGRGAEPMNGVCRRGAVDELGGAEPLMKMYARSRSFRS